MSARGLYPLPERGDSTRGLARLAPRHGHPTGNARPRTLRLHHAPVEQLLSAQLNERAKSGQLIDRNFSSLKTPIRA